MALADPKKFRGMDEDEDDLATQVQKLKQQLEVIVASARGGGGGGIDAETLERIMIKTAKMQAEASERAINPSNRDHLHLGVYTHPDGDLKMPRTLKCPMFWVGYDLREDTTTYDEIQMLNTAQPGTYTFRRTDGFTTETMTVTAQRGPDGSITKLNFDFPVRENRDTLPSMSNMLRQAFGIKTPEQIELDKLRSEVESLRRKADAVPA